MNTWENERLYLLKNMGLTPKLKLKILKRSNIPSCFDGRCNMCPEENIQIMLYFDPGSLLNYDMI